MAISDEIELFLRNALKAKALEDRLIRQALSDLRQTLLAVERLVGQSGSLALGPNRDTTIRAVSTAVARSVQQTWGAPTLGSLQEALAPFVEQQLTFARQMVEAAGGTLTSEGAASLQVRQVVNNAVINGKTLADTLTAVVPAQVADKVERYIRLGLSDVGGEVVATYQDAVVRTVERNVEAVIRTGVHEVGNAAQQAIYEFETDPDWLGEQGLVWTAVLDSAVCPICIGLDGKRFPTNYRKVSPHPNCVLGSTRVQPGTIAAAMRSVYSGNVVTIRTSKGRDLAVTEHHPVLTAHGWKPAKLVTEGDQLICQGIPDLVAPVNPDLNQSPPTAEQLFALAQKFESMPLGAVPSTTMDFHGDGARMHGQIDIACVNRELLLHGQSLCAEHVGQALLVGADSQLTNVNGLSALDALLFAMHATATGLVGSSDLSLTLLRGELTPLEGLRLALSARCDARFDEPLADGCTGDTKMLSNLVLAQAGSVELDDVKVVQIEAKHEVPVYDFSTLSGAYFADGILVHNCRCFLVPWKWRNEDMTSPSGDQVAPKRPAEGDGGEETVSFKRAAKSWVTDNPETARDIFGVRLGNQLVKGEISFDKAVKQWTSKR